VSTKEPDRIAVAEEPYRVNLTEDPWTTLRHVVEAVAIIAAGVWAFYTFIYQEKIKPGQEPAAVAVNVAIRGLGHDRYRDYFALTRRFVNTGKTEVDLAADGFNVWGERYARRQVPITSIKPNIQRYDATIPIASRRVIAAFAELRDASIGGRKGYHIIVEPGASDTLESVYAVERGRYDLIEAQLIAVPIKTSDTKKIAVRIQRESDGSYSLYPPNEYYEDDNATDYVITR
jgi:hypothetical protein